jgi:hypothetical protein
MSQALYYSPSDCSKASPCEETKWKEGKDKFPEKIAEEVEEEFDEQIERMLENEEEEELERDIIKLIEEEELDRDIVQIIEEEEFDDQVEGILEEEAKMNRLHQSQLVGSVDSDQSSRSHQLNIRNNSTISSSTCSSNPLFPSCGYCTGKECICDTCVRVYIKIEGIEKAVIIYGKGYTSLKWFDEACMPYKIRHNIGIEWVQEGRVIDVVNKYFK